jgi:hypothetical protein
MYYDEYLNRFREAKDVQLTAQGLVGGELEDYKLINYKKTSLTKLLRKLFIFRWLKDSSNFIFKVIRKIFVLYINPPEKISFSEGDVVFIPGSNLAYKNYMTRLKERKDEKNLVVVQVVHDALPITTPQFFSSDLNKKYTAYFKDIVAIADHIVSVSHATENEVRESIKKLNLSGKPQFHVIHSGSSIDAKKSSKPKEFPFKPGEYLMSWGTIEPRKNRELLYYAYKAAKRNGIDMPPMVVAGKVGWLSDDFFMIVTRDKDIADTFIIIESPHDEELLWLIKNCKFSVYPSHAEGWGLPIAESLHYKKTCISVNTSSMPEVAGDVIEYIQNPYDTKEITEKIIKLSKPENLKKAEDKIKKFKPVSWDDSVKQYASLLRKAL